MTPTQALVAALLFGLGSLVLGIIVACVLQHLDRDKD